LSDPFARASQALTDALLQLDQAITLAEGNVAAAKQLGLPEAADLGARLPAIILRAREFLASVPTISQAPRWGEQRRLLDQAAAFRPLFAPYALLGQRVAMAKQVSADRLTREKAAAAEVERAKLTYESNAMLETARRRFSALRQTSAEMQLQRGPGFDDALWLGAVRSIGSILSAQDVRLAAAAASVRGRSFEEARATLDQALGELQAALDYAQRARSAANARAQMAPHGGTELPPAPGTASAAKDVTQPISLPRAGRPASGVPSPALPAGPVPGAVPPVPIPAPQVRQVSLIEVRGGSIFRTVKFPAVIGRGLDSPMPPGQQYLDLSQACDPGDADELGISRRHAEIAREASGAIAVRDLNSTNGTRQRRAGGGAWVALAPGEWSSLGEGDELQFGLLSCTVSFSR
jgi:hypothetical protein